MGACPAVGKGGTQPDPAEAGSIQISPGLVIHISCTLPSGGFLSTQTFGVAGLRILSTQTFGALLLITDKGK